MKTKNNDYKNTIWHWYTVVDEKAKKENRIYLDFNPKKLGKPVLMSFPQDSIIICPQQLAELGHLLITLSNNEYDKDSINELLNGYGLET